MTLDELIERLQQVRHDWEAGSFSVVMTTQAGSGEVDHVDVAVDTVSGRSEVWLQEKPWRFTGVSQQVTTREQP